MRPDVIDAIAAGIAQANTATGDGPEIGDYAARRVAVEILGRLAPLVGDAIDPVKFIADALGYRQ